MHRFGKLLRGRGDGEETAPFYRVDRYGPSDEPRRPPPPGDLVRLTFLVSDGLYFGEGSYEVLMQDAAGGPILNEGGDLLSGLVDAALDQEKSGA